MLFSSKAEVAVVPASAQAAIVLVALLLAGTEAVAVGDKPNLGVVIVGAGSDQRPVTAPGQPLSFRIGLDNMSGVVDAHHVRLSAVLPSGLKFQSSDPPPTKLESGNQPVWEIDSVRAKALPRLFEVTAATEPNLATGTRLNISAGAESSEGNARPEDGHATYTLYVEPIGPALVLRDSTLESAPLTPDAPTTFQVSVMNAGNLTAADARLIVTLPGPVKFSKADPPPESSDGQKSTFKLGDLARGASHSVTIMVTLDPKQVPTVLQSDRVLTFAFDLSHAGSAGQLTDSHTEITKKVEFEGPDVAVWLTAEGAKDPGEVSPESDATYRVLYANLGNRTAHTVNVKLSVGPGLAIANADPTPARIIPTQAGGETGEWDIGEVQVSASGSISSSIHVTSVPDDGAIVHAVITAGENDTDTSNNTQSVVVHRSASAATLASAAQSKGGNAATGRPTWRLILLWLVVLIVVGAILQQAWRRASRR
jgi:hypothetical protein